MLTIGVVAVLALGGCGGDEDEPAAPPAPPAEEPSAPSGAKGLTLTADPGGALRFDKKSLEIAAGEVQITMDNPSSVPHNVAIEGKGVDEKGDVVGKGGTSRVTATLRAGKYTFYCSVPGHREGGMFGTLDAR